MNFRWRRRLSSIQLILGDTRRAPGPSERARKKAVREHSTLSSETPELMSWSPTWDSNDLPWFGRLVALAYPVWDVLFLALLVRLLAGFGLRLLALRLLTGACALWLAYDSVYAPVLQYGSYDQGFLIDIP